MTILYATWREFKHDWLGVHDWQEWDSPKFYPPYTQKMKYCRYCGRIERI